MEKEIKNFEIQKLDFFSIISEVYFLFGPKDSQESVIDAWEILMSSFQKSTISYVKMLIITKELFLILWFLNQLFLQLQNKN